MLTPEERTDLIQAAKQHPDLLALMRQITEGYTEEPRQVRRPNHALGVGYAGRRER